jgi:hypothetical protein
MVYEGFKTSCCAGDWRNVDIIAAKVFPGCWALTRLWVCAEYEGAMLDVKMG